MVGAVTAFRDPVPKPGPLVPGFFVYGSIPSVLIPIRPRGGAMAPQGQPDHIPAGLSRTQSRAILPSMISAASVPLTSTGPPSGPALQGSTPSP